MKLRIWDIAAVITEAEQLDFAALPARHGDVELTGSITGGGLRVALCADRTPVRYIRLRWNFTAEEKRNESVRVLGDEWERGYGNMEWHGIVPHRAMPWACAVSNGSDSVLDYAGRYTECFGVKVRAGAMCFWQYDNAGITLWLDVRNGGSGVLLGGRTLQAAEVRFGDYRDVSAFDAVDAFYGTLCDDALVPDHKVYGSNNWYYAYGNSSHEDILRDTELVAKQCEGLVNRPYMVIDDGWQPNRCDAPWDRGNERFPDMKRLADEMKAKDVRPGIWVRYLIDKHHETEGITPDMRMTRDDNVLDPSNPKVLELVRTTTKRIVEEWGYQLIKHDFSTFDIFGYWAWERKDTLTSEGWHFYDRTRTTAEIVVDFYRTIREAAGPKTVIIGCNVIGFLTAGLAEANRTGDDTSGRKWDITRKMGVNTLAFHMPQDKNFFAADADCVGITAKVPWEMNRKWLKILSESGTPLFVSCTPGLLNEDQLAELRDAFTRNSVQKDVLKPIDWMETVCPTRWLLNGLEESFDWFDRDGALGFNPQF